MFNLIGNKKLHPFGLDISEKSLKIVQLSPQKIGFRPNAISEMSLPSGLINNHVITNDQKLADLILQGTKQAKSLVGNTVVAGVPEAKCFVRILTIPKMDVNELDASLRWELEQDIPVPIDQVYLDWQLVGDAEDKMKVLVTAAPKEYIDSLVNVLKLAKLRPVAFELDSQSTARAAIGSDDVEQSVLLVDMSSSDTSFAVVTKGVLEYTASIPLGGNSITQNIMQDLKISESEAEKLKIDNGLVEDTKRGNVKQNIIPVLDSVVDEIRNVIKYHDEHALFDIPVSRVILSGGASKLLGMSDYISARLNVGNGKHVGLVGLADPWVNVAEINNRQHFPNTDDSLEYTTAIGLALRGVLIDENH